MNLRFGRVALVVALLAASAGIARWRRPERAFSPHPTPAVGVASPERPVQALPATGAILGINEALCLPDSPFITGAPDQELSRRVLLLSSVGAGSVRVNSHTWPKLNFRDFRDFQASDALVSFAGHRGLSLLVVLGPWPGARTAAYTAHYLPDDMAGYVAWVGSVVERYDGDGTGDMPGLALPVHTWEVDNEPDLHNSVAPKGGAGPQGLAFEADTPAGKRDAFETPAEYAEILIQTSAAIHAADPTATVVSGGLYQAATPRGRTYLANLFAVAGAAAAADVIGVHCYFEQDSLEPVDAALAAIHRVLPDKPVWITETSVPSAGRQPWMDEAWQARMLVGIAGEMLAAGGDRLWWHTLTDPPTQEGSGPGGYRKNSLFRTESTDSHTRFVPKLSGETFGRLARHLGTLAAPAFRPLADRNAGILESEGGWLVYRGEAACPEGAGAVENLLTGETAAPRGVVAAPAWISK